MSNDTFNSDINGLFTLHFVQQKKVRTIDRALQWAEEADMNKVEFAAKIGTSAQNLNNWISRGMPSSYDAKVAQLFGRSVEELLGIGTNPSGTTATSVRASYSNSRRVPVVGTAQLGPDGYWVETGHPTGAGDGFIDLHSKDENAYAVRVIGDSMHPRIKSGEYVVVEPNHPVNPGDEVLVVTRDGRSMVKEYLFKRGGIVALNSVNDQHGRISLPEDQIEKMHYVAAIARSALHDPS